MSEPLKSGVRIEESKSRFGFTKTRWFRICSGCKKEWEVDEGRCTYDEWYCGECASRMGF